MLDELLMAFAKMEENGILILKGIAEGKDSVLSHRCLGSGSALREE